MSIESSPEPEEPESEHDQARQHRASRLRSFLARLGVGGAEARQGGDESVSGGNTSEQPAAPQAVTIRDVLAKLDEQREADVPPDLPIPYELGIQEYPGNALWRLTVNTPEEEATALRALSKLDPPHVLAERDAD